MMLSRLQNLIMGGLSVAMIACVGTTSFKDATSAAAGSDYHPADRGWVLDWADEFDGDSLDSTKWKAEQSCWGGGNDERQCYTDRAKNIEVMNGKLRLKAYPETFTGPEFPEGHPAFPGGTRTQDYTSGKIRTRKLATWTYGRFEARIKLPTGQGTWPAFWMMSDDDSYGAWPLSGEIDIMEAVNLGASCEVCNGGTENRTFNALHYGELWPDNDYKSTQSALPDDIDRYHVYAVEWGAERINWFVNGKCTFSMSADEWFTDAVTKSEDPNAPFDRPFYMMMNLAVGGRLSEDNNDKGFDPETYPAEMVIDWVRVYRCEPDASAQSCMTTEP